MATILNRTTTFATNGTVTAAGLHNLIDDTSIYAGLITTQTELTTVGTADQLLIAVSGISDTGAPRRATVQNLFDDALTGGTYTNAQLSGFLTYGTATGNRTVSTSATITTGTIPNLTSSTANITLGTIPTLTTGTTTSTAANITNGTVQTLTASTANISQGSAILTQGTIGTLNSTTGTIATLNSTTGTIGTFNSTTGTIGTLVATETITGSTNVINIGSGQIVKAANGNVTLGGDAGDTLRYLDVQNTNSSANAGVDLRLITRNAADSDNIAVDIVKYKTGGFEIANRETNAAAYTSFYVGASERMRIDSVGDVGIGVTAPVNKLEIVGSFGRGAPVTKTGDFTLADTENWIIVNKGSTGTATLPGASSWTGREFTIKTIQAFAVVSASSNVIPRIGGAAGTAILPATDGAWATLVSNGANWEIMCGS
jgi:hypothetical protein